LAEAQKEASQLSDVLERYRTERIRNTETLHTEILELLGQCNLDAPPTSFPRCSVGAFYEWVSACFDLITMNAKIFGELGAAVGGSHTGILGMLSGPSKSPLLREDN
jgi:hypothetical protein